MSKLQEIIKHIRQSSVTPDAVFLLPEDLKDVVAEATILSSGEITADGFRIMGVPLKAMEVSFDDPAR